MTEADHVATSIIVRGSNWINGIAELTKQAAWLLAAALVLVVIAPALWKSISTPSGIVLEKPVLADDKIGGRNAEFYSLERRVTKPEHQVVAKTGIHDTLDAVITAVVSLDGRNRRVSLLIECAPRCESDDTRSGVRISGVVGLADDVLKPFDIKGDTNDRAIVAAAASIAAATMPATLAGAYLADERHDKLHALVDHIMRDPRVSTQEKELLSLMKAFAEYLDLADVARRAFREWRDIGVKQDHAGFITKKLQAAAARVPMRLGRGPETMLGGLLSFHEGRMHLARGDRDSAEKAGERTIWLLSQALARPNAAGGAISRAIALTHLEAGRFEQAARSFKAIRMDDLPEEGRYVVRRDYGRALFCAGTGIDAIRVALADLRVETKEKILSTLPKFQPACNRLR